MSRYPQRPLAPHVQAAIAAAQPKKTEATSGERQLAAHVQRAVAGAIQPSAQATGLAPRGGPGGVQPGPHRNRLSTVRVAQLSAEPRARRLTQLQLDQAVSQLAAFWKSRKQAGTHDSTIDLSSASRHGCAARATLAAGGTLDGTFKSEECHAEMDLVGQLLGRSGGGNPAHLVTKIEIEKEPCTRCAVVLNQLGLSGLVTYKNTGQKDYPTWRFPDSIGTEEESLILGINAYATDPRDKAEMAQYFRTRKWW